MNEFCNGEAEVETAPLRKAAESRLEEDDSGGGTMTGFCRR
jgi:hypothetical protein